MRLLPRKGGHNTEKRQREPCQRQERTLTEGKGMAGGQRESCRPRLLPFCFLRLSGELLHLCTPRLLRERQTCQFWSRVPLKLSQIVRILRILPVLGEKGTVRRRHALQRHCARKVQGENIPHGCLPPSSRRSSQQLPTESSGKAARVSSSTLRRHGTSNTPQEAG